MNKNKLAYRIVEMLTKEYDLEDKPTSYVLREINMRCLSLSCAFIWRETTEGYLYWKRICDKYHLYYARSFYSFIETYFKPENKHFIDLDRFIL